MPPRSEVPVPRCAAVAIQADYDAQPRSWKHLLDRRATAMVAAATYWGVDLVTPDLRTSSQAVEPATETAPEGNQLAKLALEFGPLLVFFLTNQFGEDVLGLTKQSKIFWATGVFMIATFVALVGSKVLFGRIPTMPLVSGVFVGVFGGLTIWLQEELFIKLKPTIVNLLFAAILFGGLLSGKSLLKYLFGDVFRLREPGWRKLTFRWACFFVVLALLNEIVWRNYSTEFWAGFKLFGIMPITLAFAISQIGLLKRYESPTKE